MFPRCPLVLSLNTLKQNQEINTKYNRIQTSELVWSWVSKEVVHCCCSHKTTAVGTAHKYNLTQNLTLHSCLAKHFPNHRRCRIEALAVQHRHNYSLDKPVVALPHRLVLAGDGYCHCLGVCYATPKAGCIAEIGGRWIWRLQHHRQRWQLGHQS